MQREKMQVAKLGTPKTKTKKGFDGRKFGSLYPFKK
jgi:hypothetical protein